MAGKGTTCFGFYVIILYLLFAKGWGGTNQSLCVAMSYSVHSGHLLLSEQESKLPWGLTALQQVMSRRRLLFLLKMLAQRRTERLSLLSFSSASFLHLLTLLMIRKKQPVWEATLCFSLVCREPEVYTSILCNLRLHQRYELCVISIILWQKHPRKVPNTGCPLRSGWLQ